MHILRQINEALASSLLEYGMPWEPQRWTGDVNAQGPPTNPLTNGRYIGIASLFLDMAAKKNDYLSKYWAVAEDWRDVDVSVQGAGHKIPYDNDQVIHSCRMWNADQLVDATKYQCVLTESVDQHEAPWGNLEKLFNDCGPTLVHNRRDYPIYSSPKPWDAFPNHTEGDIIDTPTLWQCRRGPSQYWTNLIHELCHWAEARIGWCANDAAQREFVAEMASAHLMRMHNCPLDQDCYNFMEWRDEWCKALAERPNWISYAVDYADRVIRYLLAQVANAGGPKQGTGTSGHRSLPITGWAR